MVITHARTPWEDIPVPATRDSRRSLVPRPALVSYAFFFKQILLEDFAFVNYFISSLFSKSCFVLFCFVLFCFVLFCFVLFSFCFVLFIWFSLPCFSTLFKTQTVC